MKVFDRSHMRMVFVLGDKAAGAWSWPPVLCKPWDSDYIEIFYPISLSLTRTHARTCFRGLVGCVNRSDPYCFMTVGESIQNSNFREL
jgi:hypothetical protein